MSEPDNRSKVELKRDGDYTPAYWRYLKQLRGWDLPARRARRMPKRRENTVGQNRSNAVARLAG
jgi:hypothetical protein